MTSAFLDTYRLSTRCPYTFKEIAPGSTTSEFASNKPLPRNWAGSGTICIAMVGAPDSGKSVYLAVVMRLMKQLAEEFGGNWAPADTDTQTISNEFFDKPLFEEGAKLAGTKRMTDSGSYTNKPLIFSMGKPYILGRRSQEIFVVFRDVAGEDFRNGNAQEVREQLEFLKYSDMNIFLFDPMADENIRNSLEGVSGFTSNSTYQHTGPDEVLRNLIDIVEDQRPLIGLTLAKFDVLQQLKDHADDSRNLNRIMSNLGAAFNREGNPIGEPYDAVDADLLNLEISSLLELLGARALFNLMANPSAGEGTHFFRCFAVSALGAPIKGDEVDRTGIAPFRCLDPLRYVFNHYGIGATEAPNFQA